MISFALSASLAFGLDSIGVSVFSMRAVDHRSSKSTFFFAISIKRDDDKTELFK